jgi:TIR domain
MIDAPPAQISNWSHQGRPRYSPADGGDVKVFISWSGERSHALAEALYDWLPSVLQAIEPWLSSEDIQKGSRWPFEIGARLGDANFGIFCTTPENVGSPWLNFEAGAVSKSVTEGSVATLLLGMKSADITGPLAQFQATRCEKEDLRRLIRTINHHLAAPLAEPKVDMAFDRWWQVLEASIESALTIRADTPQQRPDRELLEEVLSVVRVRNRTPTEASAAGIQRVVANFHTIEWDDLFDDATRVDLLFAYGAGWRAAHIHQIAAVLKQPGARVRIVLPNPNDQTTMEELGRRFSLAPENVTERVRVAMQEFVDLRRDSDKTAELIVATVDRTPLHTCYRVDDTVVLTPYHHGFDRRAVPALLLDRYGLLGRFYDADFDALAAGAKRVTPEQPAS